jgi:hypothetical protein
VKIMSKSRIAGLVAGLTLVLGFSNVRAAPLDLCIGGGCAGHNPDLILSGMEFSYSHDGDSGQFIINLTGRKNRGTGKTGTMLYPYDGSEYDFIQNVEYQLTADFDAVGNFVGGTVLISGDAGQLDPGTWDGGTLLSSDTLTHFGFSGVGDSGTFEFLTGAFTGDMAQFGDNFGAGIIMSTFDLTIPGSGKGKNKTPPQPWSGVWDPLNDNDMSMFVGTSFSGTAIIDTFVPVPAAVWLFGSALGLLGWMRRKKA